MTVDFNIIDAGNSIIYIEDNSVYDEEYQYCSKDELAIVNIVEKITTTGSKIIGVYDEDMITLPSDGMFKIYHVIIPTGNWLNTHQADSCASNIYIYQNNRFYKYIDSNLRKVRTEEIIEINPDSNTTVYYNYKEIFNTDYLKACMFQVNEVSLSTCQSTSDICGNGKNCKRNHLQSIINMLDYYVQCSMQFEAQRFLEDFNTCFNFCGNQEGNTKPCGCHG